MKITETILIEDLLNLKPTLEKVLEKHDLSCNGCPGAMTETIKEAAAAHGVNLEKLLADLNAAMEEE